MRGEEWKGNEVNDEEQRRRKVGRRIERDGVTAGDEWRRATCKGKE